jgi:nitroreductase
MVNEIIKKRKSIRKYEDGLKVTDEQIREILEAGMLAPSAVNSRPWEFIVVKNPEILNKISNLPNSHYDMVEKAGLAIVVCANLDLQYKDFFPQDCAAATQNILLQSAELGLGTCWCGVYPKEDKVQSFKEIFELPENIVPFNVIALGVPNEEFGARGFYEESKVKWIV